MTPLRQRLIEEIELRGFSPHTKDSYVRWVADSAKFRHAGPEQITDEQIREYLLHLLHERRLSPSSLIVAVSALRFFFGRVMGRPTEASEKALPRIKKREAGELLIRGKSARIDRLPLPSDVGRDLACYLKRGRPRCSSRRVFIRTKAPRQGSSGSGSLVAARDCDDR